MTSTLFVNCAYRLRPGLFAPAGVNKFHSRRPINGLDHVLDHFTAVILFGDNQVGLKFMVKRNHCPGPLVGRSLQTGVFQYVKVVLSILPGNTAADNTALVAALAAGRVNSHGYTRQVGYFQDTMRVNPLALPEGARVIFQKVRPEFLAEDAL
jgi:hypothetical protein